MEQLGNLRHVSIHASAWEATAHCWDGSALRYVSIHASAWEATLGAGLETSKS